ncbi:tetratricopeptide repeat protein [Streptomyces sp. 3211]|uniref:tetratricopeptide repeat protein n=1 Tax=Streptomyces sp. 3211 TaxID=1964449 RepID=UPI0009A4ACE9
MTEHAPGHGRTCRTGGVTAQQPRPSGPRPRGSYGRYGAGGRHQEAADLHQQTLASLERILGPEHPDTLTSRNNLAGLQQASSRVTGQRRWGGFLSMRRD